MSEDSTFPSLTYARLKFQFQALQWSRTPFARQPSRGFQDSYCFCGKQSHMLSDDCWRGFLASQAPNEPMSTSKGCGSQHPFNAWFESAADDKRP
eukprot:275988-Hanusia_phi.AAC.1